MKKQSTLFHEHDPHVLAELHLGEAGNLAKAIKAAGETHCEKIEVAGSIRRRKPEVHDIDFVVLAKSDSDWQGINEVLRRSKAKPTCSGNQLIKAYLPCQNGLFQVDFYRAKPSTFGIHLLIRTASADHNMWLAGYPPSQGMRLKYSEGLLKEATPIAGENEEGVFSALGLQCPLPTEREIVDDKPVWMMG